MDGEMKFKRGDVVSVAMTGIVQNRLEGDGVCITVDPEDPNRLYASRGCRFWVVVPVAAVNLLGRLWIQGLFRY